MSKKLVLAVMVAVAVPGASEAGGGFAPDPNQMFGGLEQSYGVAPGQSPVPGQQFSMLGTGFATPQMGRQPWRRPERFPHHRHHRHQSQTSLLSPRLAMHWTRLDANGRLQLETYLRQWLATLTAEQNQSLLTAINGWWERMPDFQKQFLSQLYNGASTTSAAASPATTTSAAASPATTTAAAVDPATGSLIPPATTTTATPAASVDTTAATTSTAVTTP